MQRLVRGKRLGYLFSVVFFMTCLGSFSAVADMSCTSEWVTHDEDSHCHLKLIDSENPKGALVCTAGFDLAEVNTQESCESLCQTEASALQEKLTKFFFKYAVHSQKQSMQLIQVLALLQTELQQVEQIAGKACVRAEKLEMLLEKYLPQIQGEEGGKSELEKKQKKQKEEYLPYFS